MQAQIPSKYHRKLATKLILYILVSSSLITLAITALQLYLDYSRDLDFVEEQFAQIEQSHIPALTKNLWTLNQEQIQEQLRGVSKLPFMRSVKLETEDGVITFGEEKSEYVLTRRLTLIHKEQEQQFSVGVLELTADLEEIYQHLWDKLLVILMTQAIKTFLVSAFIFFIVQRLVIQYLKAIVRYVQSINLKHLNVPLELRSHHKVPEELQELTQGINQMRSSLYDETEKIQAMTRTFKKFVPQQFLTRIAKEGLENIQLGKAESDDITILFSDLRSFTSFSETMSPQELLNFLNSYLSRINRPIHVHHGFIDKFIGDAIMALFDRPDANNADEAEDAIRAALGMQEALKDYNLHRHKVGYDPVFAGIGIHSGPVVIGTVGSEERMDSTVLGDAVNVASRIEGLTKHYNAQIIISSQTHELLKDDTFLLWRELDRVNVKGRQEPIRILEIFNTNAEAIVESKINLLKPYQEGVRSYQEQSWSEAFQLFQECLKIYPDDVVSQKYVERCLLFKDNPPPSGWNGIWEWEHK